MARIKTVVSSNGVEIEGDLAGLRKIHWSRASTTEFDLEFFEPAGEDWPKAWNFCPECGQPDNEGDCDHTPTEPNTFLAAAEWEWFVQEDTTGSRFYMKNQEEAVRLVAWIRNNMSFQDDIPQWRAASLPPLSEGKK